jgi:DNA primase
MPWQVLSVKVDGREIPPTVVTSVTRLYALAEAPEIEFHRWDVRFAAPDTDKIDVVTVGPSPRTVSDLPSCVDAG